MIPNAKKGSDIKWLMWYLAGPGRYNEHIDQRVLAGDLVTLAIFGGRIDQKRAWEAGKLMDSPRQLLLRGEPVSVTSYTKARALMAEGTSRKEAFAAATSDENTWHCSLALKPEEGSLPDEKWREIATDFMREMGFIGDATAPDVRWAAVHHGPNRSGCDHIHIAMAVVRPDGSLADMMYDHPRSQRAAGVIERRHGLQVLLSRETGETEKATTPAERSHMQRVGAPETDREALRRRVRGAAVVAGSEAEWLRGLREQQIVVRPRFAKDSTTEVTGYSVRMPAQRNTRTGEWETPRGYSGLQLGRDLTLPALRSWAGWDTSETAAQEATGEWQRLLDSSARWRGRPDPAAVDPAALTHAVASLSRWGEQLREIPVTDQAGWRRAASQTSGLLAAASVSTEATPGPLDRLSRQLARVGDTDPALRRRPGGVRRTDLTAARAAARAAWSRTSPQASQIALMQALTACFLAVAQARAAGESAQAAAAAASQARQALTEIHMRAAGVDPARPYESTPGSPAWVAAYRAAAYLDGEDPADTASVVEAQQTMYATSTNRTAQKPMTPARPSPWRSLDDERTAQDGAAAELAALQYSRKPVNPTVQRQSPGRGRPSAKPHRPERGGGFER